jgi:hypothetical protein
MDARYGRTLYIESHAHDEQRAAVNDIANDLMGLRNSEQFYPCQSMAHNATLVNGCTTKLSQWL